MLVTVNNGLKFEIEIVHDLSCHPIYQTIDAMSGMQIDSGLRKQIQLECCHSLPSQQTYVHVCRLVTYTQCFRKKTGVEVVRNSQIMFLCLFRICTLSIRGTISFTDKSNYVCRQS